MPIKKHYCGHKKKEHRRGHSERQPEGMQQAELLEKSLLQVLTQSFVFLSFCLFVFLSFCLFVFLSFCLFVFLSFCLFVFLSFCLFDHIAHIAMSLKLTVVAIMGFSLRVCNRLSFW